MVRSLSVAAQITRLRCGRLDRRMPQHPGRPQAPFLFVLPMPPPRSAGRGGEKVGLLVKLVTSETDMLKKCETCYKCD
jgi:hypothetical protein